MADVGGGLAGPPPPVPPFTAAHETFRSELRAWIADELAPYADEWEEARWVPDEAFRLVGEAGYFGLTGAEAAVWAEELPRCGSGGVAAALGAHSGIALPPIEKFGTDEQRRRFVEPGRRGELIAALAITEPDAGSDVASIRTAASRVDGGYLVNGSKMFITGGCRADVLVTAVKTTAQGSHHGLSFLIVERGKSAGADSLASFAGAKLGDGVESRAIEKLGWHASDTALITFEDVFVPDENLLGAENAGFQLIMANFQWERIAMSLGAVGAMRVAFEHTLTRVCSPGQAARHTLAQVATSIEAARAVTLSALRRHLAGLDAVREVTMAKLATQRAAFEAIDRCLALTGPDRQLERALRDARLGPIGGGTDEIMKEILGRSLGL